MKIFEDLFFVNEFERHFVADILVGVFGMGRNSIQINSIGPLRRRDRRREEYLPQMEIRFTQMNLIQVVDRGSTWLTVGGFHGWGKAEKCD
ncbi:MAG TPA: hypothetical protein VGG44_11825 [Tepidisphaeraceae bacterium]